MKQIITYAAFIAFSFAGITAHAQSNNTVAAGDKVLLKGEVITMKDGKPVLIKDGKSIVLQGNVVTVNGHKIMPDGTIIYNTGFSTILKETETVSADGNITIKNDHAERAKILTDNK
jgi:tartrate dehydratase beta subunit/fumarate hydratase class I family protein